jgi:hypothetical protein
MEEEAFDFEKEIKEFVENSYVKSITLQVHEPHFKATVSLITLDGLPIKADWSVTDGGLTITEGEGHVGKQFEDMNCLLQTCSPLYREAFGQSLFSKLLSAQNE